MGAKQAYNEHELVLFMLGAICVFFAFFLFFLTATFIKRSNKLRNQRKSEQYQKTGNEILFNLLFGNTTMEEALQQFHSLDKSYLLIQAMTRSTISLHRNYAGEQRKILEHFFLLSGLSDFSYKKLRSGRWVEVVEGIRVLSVLNVREAFDEIRSLLDHPHVNVKKEAFIGLITLEGMEGLEKFPLPKIPIDDWTQSCILYQLKIKSFSSFEGIHLFLESKNESLVLLGARIADYFQLHESYAFILNMQQELQKYRQEFAAIRNRILKNMPS
jgi:hypothetical protein